MSVISQGEKSVAQFFRSFWPGDDDARFGVVDAAKVLRGRDLAVIIGWLSAPFSMTCIAIRAHHESA